MNQCSASLRQPSGHEMLALAKCNPMLRVSVVVPTFRRPALLKACLEALLTQLLDPVSYEVIVVSDGPDPMTSVIVNEMSGLVRAGKLRYYSLKRKKGPAAARNLGWRMAAGNLIVFTDDDCLPDARWLEHYAAGYRRFPGSAFTGRVRVPLRGVPTDYERNIAHLETAEFITANCAVPKEILEILGGFDEAFPSAWREDSDLHFKLLENQIPIRHLTGALVCHPVRKAAWGVSLKEEKKNSANALLYKKHPRLYRSHIAEGPNWNYFIILSCFVSAVALLFFRFHVAALIFGLVWISLCLVFSARRLKGSSRQFSHILEMIATSVLIPFVSVFWSVCGAFRHRVWFLN